MPSITSSLYSVTEHQLSKFIAFIYQEGLSAGTMKTYLVAVRHAQISMGLGDPPMVRMPQLQFVYVLKGARRRLAKRAKQIRLPVTPEILQFLRKSWERLHVKADASMLWAAATFCFFGFLWTQEAMAPSDSGFEARYHLSYGDVLVNNVQNPLWMEVHIKRSKRDQFAEGIRFSLEQHNQTCSK